MTILKFPEVIDNTMRKAWVKCPKSAYYKHERGLSLIGEGRVDLVAGAAFAAGLEAARRAHYVEGADAHKSLDMGLDALFRSYGDFTPPDKSNKSAPRMAGALTYYLNERPLADELLKPIYFPKALKWSIELNFHFPIEVTGPDGPLAYGGSFDMLAIDPQGIAWVVDEKTTSQLGDKWANQWPLDSQMTGYCWGARKLLDSEGMENVTVGGAIINGIAIKLRDYDLVRVQTQRQPWEIERWYNQLLGNLEDWVAVSATDLHMMALDHACAFYNNPCEYAGLCKSRDPERIIPGTFEVKFWNPVTRSNESC